MMPWAAGKRTLQQQAVLAAASQSSTGPLGKQLPSKRSAASHNMLAAMSVILAGTIPDDATFDAANSSCNIAETSSSSSRAYSASSWDDYFDSMQDIHLTERDGTFRCVAHLHLLPLGSTTSSFDGCLQMAACRYQLIWSLAKSVFCSVSVSAYIQGLLGRQ